MTKLNVKALNASLVFGGKEMIIHPVLIFDEEKAVLVDSGFSGQFEVLKKEIEKYIDINKLKSLVITHHDIDHIGTAKEFKNLLGDNLKIYSTDVEADYISGKKTPHKLAALENNKENLDENSKGRLEFFRNGFNKSFVEVDETFKAGDNLPIFNEVQTLDMPGHTIGHICIYIPSQKTLLTGDALMLQDGKLIRSRNASNFNPEQAIQSLDKLRGLDIEKVLCYHGGEYLGKVDVDELQK